MKNSFEHHKVLEAKLEEIPQTTPETHFELNDISKKLIEGGEFSMDDMSFLEVIHDYLQKLDPGIVHCLDEYRARDILQKEEYLIVVDFFFIAQQNGPESNVLSRAMQDRKVSVSDFCGLISSISIPEHTRELIIRVYEKISS